ncbi:hypothetical protein GPECTOR_8g328 [Gonium pectorale]|uniref:Uncharacterized protein n=1 Tax=Gonium pectorale TaxID=33097 RepID=A0A150GT44_GONPE|nr:hypothetical protein GPECTOR_8g328 [Gonium pectorale]|eukprot:KXZ52954.1 hypothetical protein GPECTOR_8g328 [Gonium pectorale]
MLGGARDAAHDYCSVRQDLELYWPKVRSGGLMAGHDYVNASEAMAYNALDFSTCPNGTVHQGAVRGAVDEFFGALGLTVQTTQEAYWKSWLVFKP